MALKDTWRDKQNGIDDILAEDINEMAHAIIENEKKIEDKSEETHTHGFASYTTIHNANFEGRTTINYGADRGATFTSDTLVAGSRRSTFKVACEGDVIIDFSPNSVASFDVDGIDALSEIVPVEGIVGVSRWQGEVINNIVFGIKANSSLTLYSFTTDKYTNGFMTGRQVKELENAPTTKDVQNIVNEAFGIVVEAFDEVHEYAENIGGDEA